MTSPSRDRAKWIALSLLGWTFLAAIPTSSAYIIDGSAGFGRWLGIFRYIAPWYYLWALVTPLIYRLGQGPLSPQRSWPMAVAGHILLAAGFSMLFAVLIHQDNAPAWLAGRNAIGYYAMSAFSYLLILMGIHGYNIQQRLRQQEALVAREQQRALQLKADLAAAQIAQLRGQMNPHFLFNALNCIGALIETGRNDQAYTALEDLGDLLRTSLERRDQGLAPLNEELQFAERYLAMERVRFGERLQVTTDVDSAAAQWPVPAFLLQPLIENAIKHAVAPSKKPVTVNITACRDGEHVRIEVADTGSNPSGAPGTGVGLENLGKRLQLLYGEQAELEFVQNEGGARVILRIPQASARAQTDQGGANAPDRLHDPAGLGDPVPT